MLLIPGLALLVGCSQTPAGREPIATSPVSSAGSSSLSSGAIGFRNPVYDGNFPDPMVVDGGNGTYWAFATNGNGSNVQTMKSKNLINWVSSSDALPQLPDWSNPGKVWAPEVARNKAGFVLYYTTSVMSSGVQCVGVGVATSLSGPYIDKSHRPLVCQLDEGGSIDAHPFTASNGKRYLYWKNDGNAIGLDTYISVQQLDDTGTTLVGKPKRLFKQDLAWEGRLVEAPFVWEENGRFHLFYSANAFDSYSYAIGHAVADTPLGPFTKRQEPVVVSNDVAAGPGHCALIRKGDKVWMLYHAWPPDAVGSDLPGRNPWLSEVVFTQDGSVTVVPPTVEYPTRP
jgi:beta-xylosidase